jgi:cell division protein WhiA
VVTRRQRQTAAEVEEGAFSEAVRAELVALPAVSEREARAELVGMLLVTARDGVLGEQLVRGLGAHRPGAIPLAPLCADGALVLTVTSSAVARRVVLLMQRALDLRPTLTVVRAAARRGRHDSFRVSLPSDRVVQHERFRGPAPDPAPAPGGTDHAPMDDDGPDPETIALLRGAFIAVGSISAPDRPAHLELGPVGRGAAPLLAAALAQVAPDLAPHHDAARGRIVVKSGSAVADLLAALGATRAFLTYDDRRLRRQLRGEANRLANADAANLARTVSRAALEVDAIERAVAAAGWEVFDETLREVALARLANPAASVRDLAVLLAVPRATLHRRLQRVVEAAAGHDAGS